MNMKENPIAKKAARLYSVRRSLKKSFGKIRPIKSAKVIVATIFTL